MTDIIEKAASAIERAMYPYQHIRDHEEAARAALKVILQDMMHMNRRMYDAYVTSLEVSKPPEKGQLSRRRKARTRWQAMLTAYAHENGMDLKVGTAEKANDTQ